MISGDTQRISIIFQLGGFTHPLPLVSSQASGVKPAQNHRHLFGRIGEVLFSGRVWCPIADRSRPGRSELAHQSAQGAGRRASEVLQPILGEEPFELGGNVRRDVEELQPDLVLPQSKPPGPPDLGLDANTAVPIEQG